MSVPLPPNWRNVSLPERLRTHSLISQKFFFTLPIALLKLLRDSRILSDCELWELEDVLSQLIGDHSVAVGFFDGNRVFYSYLQIKVSRSGTAGKVPDVSQLGWGRDYDSNLVQELYSRLDDAKSNLRAYLGWLLVNPQFHAEHRELMRDLGDEYFRHGPPQRPYDSPEQLRQMASTKLKSASATVDPAFNAFSTKWRLSCLTAPFLPVPLPIQAPTIDTPLGQHFQTQVGMRSIAIPDIFPMPSGSEVQELLEGATTSPEAPDNQHLSEWLELCSKSNRNQPPFQRYERLFELQHYTRILYSRHAGALSRKQSQLQVVFGEYFGVTDDTIKRDFAFLQKRLGKAGSTISEAD